MYHESLPDVILYPTGVALNSSGCGRHSKKWKRSVGSQRNGRACSRCRLPVSPIVRAFQAGEKEAAEFANARTVASGLGVPKAIGDFLILNILGESNGGAIAVGAEEMIRVAREIGAKAGLSFCPKGAACFAAFKLLRRKAIASGERVVVFNTGSGIKYLEVY